MQSNQLSFGKALLLMTAVCTTYALLIPADVLTRLPRLEPFISVMEAMFPAIEGFAKFSPIPQVVRLYYSTLWLLSPFAFLWFFKYVRVQERPVSATLTRPKAALFLVSSILFTALLVYLLGFHVPPAESSIRAVATGGRGNALLVGLTANSISIGVVSSLFMAAIFLFGMSTSTLLKLVIRGKTIG